MSKLDVERLKKYLSLITRKTGGLEGAIESVFVRLQEDSRSELQILSGSSRPLEVARSGVESFAGNRDLSMEEYSALEAIINAELRPAVDVVDGRFSITHPLWRKLSEDADIRGRIEACIPSIGRVELPGHSSLPYGGTAFIVGDGLIMTNRHVAEIFATGVGDRRLRFLSGAKAGIDFLREQGRPTGPTVMVRRVAMIHPYWDMAILAVDDLPVTRTPLKLSLMDARDLVGRDIFVIGYPAFDPRNPATEQQDLFNGKFGVKRLQPGELQGGMKTASFGKMVHSATHDCSTLGGNSGSAVIDLNTGEVLGLHFGGVYHQQNFAVPSSELARDTRVIDTGILFAGTPSKAYGSNEWSDWWKRADTSEASISTSTVTKPEPTSGRSWVTASNADGAVFVEVPLRITISMRTPPEAVIQDATEGLREPEHDPDYSSRRGYNSDFLNNIPGLRAIDVPMPDAADAGVLAKARSGGNVLHYQNFSIKMHASRRLAMVTASNVTKEPELRKPDPGNDYTRKGLSGLGKNDQERWFLDSRLDDRFQLPDVFFTKDRKAFDKGHLVRRDDIAWGTSYEEVKRANGDSYHVTNCSPQVAGFNQSAKGENNWGDLENHVLSEAASERLCVFAGPVLDHEDEVFVGVGDNGTVLRAKIPSRYWKVIVARIEDGLAAYGFLLEQNLSDVQFEFSVPTEFVPSLYPIADIEAMTGVSFGESVRNSDQFGTLRGVEIALRSGIGRKRLSL